MPPKKTMKAAVIHSFDGIQQVALETIPTPSFGPDDVLVSVEYAGVNPVDWKICDGMLKERMKYSFPITLGWDVSGTIIAKGKNVTGFKEGDPILAYCRKNEVHDGSFAEYLSLPAEQVVTKPANLTFAEAASIPLASLTAWQSLFDTAHLKSNESVLIHAGSGGVGGFAIQFAKLAGAKVITTTSARHVDYVKQLGADIIIDYSKENFVDKVHSLFPKGVDVIYDTIGGPTLNASYDASKEGGRLVSIAGIVDKALATKKHIDAQFLFVSPNKKELSHIVSLFEKGSIVLPSIQEMPFDKVKSALQKSKEGHVEGKIVLKIKV